MTTSPYYDSGPLAGSGIDVTVEVQPQACGVLDEYDEPACSYEGTVDVRYDGARGTWTCPDCSAEWETWR